MTSHDGLYRRPYRPIHPAFVAVGAALLIAAFATDFLYWQTLLFQWNNFSAWLLVVGLIAAGCAAIAFIFDAATHRLARIAWLRLAGLSIAALLSVLNAFVHSRDSYTAVVPEGIALSAIAALLLIVVGFRGWTLEAPQPYALQARETRR